MKKGTQLLEIYALEIQMYTAQKNNKKLKALYDQSLHIKSAIPHPLILGTSFKIRIHIQYYFFVLNEKKIDLMNEWDEWNTNKMDYHKSVTLTSIY